MEEDIGATSTAPIGSAGISKDVTIIASLATVKNYAFNQGQQQENAMPSSANEFFSQTGIPVHFTNDMNLPFNTKNNGPERNNHNNMVENERNNNNEVPKLNRFLQPRTQPTQNQPAQQNKGGSKNFSANVESNHQSTSHLLNPQNVENKSFVSKIELSSKEKKIIEYFKDKVNEFYGENGNWQNRKYAKGIAKDNGKEIMIDEYDMIFIGCKSLGRKILHSDQDLQELMKNSGYGIEELKKAVHNKQQQSQSK